jgi:OOP family OmpA-OmpF porin
MRNAQTAGFFARFFSFLAFLGLMMVGPAAFAANQGYLGASFGQSKSDDLADAISTGFALAGVPSSVDESDSAWKLFGGFEVSQNLSVEFAYVDLGEVTGKGGGATVSVESSGFSASVLGTIPLSQRAGIFGRFGLFNWDADISGSGPGGSLVASDSGTDLAFGFGANFGLGRNTKIRVEWERFELDDVDADLISVGLSIGL